MLLLGIARAVGRSHGGTLHEVDIKSLDPNSLFRQPLAEIGQAVRELSPGRLGLGLHAGHHHSILHADLQTQRAKFRRAEAQTHFTTTLFG